MKRTPPKTPALADLAGSEVLVAVCGGIAAYKVCYVVSELVQRGAGVTVAMTPAARKFVGPATFEALSGRPVLRSMWTSKAATDVQHISVTESADLLLIAPATANIIGKIACGIADDLVSTLVISAASPVVIAPAMNDRMWSSRAVQDNMAKLTERGCVTIGPAEGWLACGTVGPGRMVEPGEIMDVIEPILKETKGQRAKQARTGG